MTRIAGVDGCHGGWFVVTAEVSGDDLGSWTHLVCHTFCDVLGATSEAAATCIDMPVGLPERPGGGGRRCDHEARITLGRRGRSVFSPPTRPQCEALTFPDAHALGPLTLQAYAIGGKIIEVDDLMTPELQRRVFEVHPELCFCALNGEPMKHRKKSLEGRAERLLALSPHFPAVRAAAEGERRSGVVGIDDILDAYAALHTALRITRNEAGRMPNDPEVDSKGLRMEMWY